MTRPWRGATLSLLPILTNGLLLSANVEDVLALLNVLLSFSEGISNSWVDVFTDSQVIIIIIIITLFSVVSTSNIHVSLHLIGSDTKLADAPSHSLSLQDSKLSEETWTLV